MFPAAYGETVTRLRAPMVADPYSGEGDLPDWDAATEVAVPGCAFWIESSVEPDQVDRASVISVAKVLAPFGADFLPHDRFVARGVTYEVVGEPNHLHSPFSGWEPGCEVTGRRVDG